MNAIKPKAVIDELTQREGLKKSISRAQVAEVVGALADMVFKSKRSSAYANCLYRLGESRNKRRKAARARRHGRRG